jgi:hypothetical protein
MYQRCGGLLIWKVSRCQSQCLHLSAREASLPVAGLCSLVAGRRTKTEESEGMCRVTRVEGLFFARASESSTYESSSRLTAKRSIPKANKNSNIWHELRSNAFSGRSKKKQPQTSIPTLRTGQPFNEAPSELGPPRPRYKFTQDHPNRGYSAGWNRNYGLFVATTPEFRTPMLTAGTGQIQRLFQPKLN